MQLPPDLRAAIETITGQSGLAALRDAAAAVSARYRGKARVDAAIKSDDEARAYLGARFPATYVAAYDVLSRVAQAREGFTPASLLDIGAGPGTVALAALAIWPEIETVILLEPNLYLRRAGQEIFDALGLAGRVKWIEKQIQSADLPEADIVTAGYVMNEIIRDDEIEALTAKIWQAAGDTLAMIEPGTPEGNAIILRIRAALLKAGANMVAPCPHSAECPLQGTLAWCHFSTRVERSKLHRSLKDGAVLGYEDEKFSYVALSRKTAILPAHRVIGYPAGSKIVQLQLCNQDGMASNAQIAKNRPQYKVCRKLEWGDAVDEVL
jgi:ribosomal protein RSM22 (predicted rRNA methylase)